MKKVSKSEILLDGKKTLGKSKSLKITFCLVSTPRHLLVEKKWRVKSSTVTANETRALLAVISRYPTLLRMWQVENLVAIAEGSLEYSSTLRFCYGKKEWNLILLEESCARLEVILIVQRTVSLRGEHDRL